MSKKLKIMSLSLEPELHELLKDHAKLKGQSVSEFIRKWCKQYPFNNNGVIPVVIDIPENLTGDSEGMSSYLAQKSAAIVKALCG